MSENIDFTVVVDTAIREYIDKLVQELFGINSLPKDMVNT